MRIGDFLSNSEEDVLRISKGHFIYLFSDKNCVNKKNSVKMYGDIEIYNNFLKQKSALTHYIVAEENCYKLFKNLFGIQSAKYNKHLLINNLFSFYITILMNIIS